MSNDYLAFFPFSLFPFSTSPYRGLRALGNRMLIFTRLVHNLEPSRCSSGRSHRSHLSPFPPWRANLHWRADNVFLYSLLILILWMGSFCPLVWGSCWWSGGFRRGGYTSGRGKWVGCSRVPQVLNRNGENWLIRTICPFGVLVWKPEVTHISIPVNIIKNISFG